MTTEVDVDIDQPAVASHLESSLPGSYYLSKEIFQREKEHIFFRDWYCVGREEQVPNPGDYLVVDVLGESIIILRSKTGALNGFYNVCRHRGCRLALEDTPRPQEGDGPSGSGSFHNSITCPYHQWSYNFEGKLRGTPYLRESDRFKKENFSLYPVGVDVWGGFMFVNLSPAEAGAEGRTLLQQLGLVPEEFKRYPLSSLRVGKRLVYEVEANWKVVMENYNECYHCGGVHPELCELVPAFKQHGGSELDWANGIPHRDGATTFTFSGTTNRVPFEGLDDFEITRHKGQLIYPNLLVSFSSDHIAAFTLWARDPGHTTITCDFLFDPREMAKPDYDPSDAVEFWDVVNKQDWVICSGVQRGMSSRPFGSGYYAQMEDSSLDIRRYVSSRLGSIK
ncbi:MAG: aromatic ring-hydroxylating dioxygenase subunit alpha [Chloroflexi bacterium]|jgi:Rieske 2Fe-2S family protein|nr:aromatic ring-hydroxylating dioxygenase subunit alpha [Chloroflexota bacterium]